MSIIGESGVCKFPHSHRSSSHSNKRLSVWRYIIFCRQPPVFSLNLSLSHSERCHSCDLSSCRRKCKYIQTVSHHHFTLQKLARITSDSQSHKSSSCISSHSLAIFQFPSASPFQSKTVCRIHYFAKAFKPTASANLHQSDSSIPHRYVWGWIMMIHTVGHRCLATLMQNKETHMKMYYQWL